ncbi:ribokinase [Fannyhessea vaginae]|uniref:ribokinase n=1 Tax=Fannyhessea vaginae TaxID=82135 RepID=UPI003B20BAD7
MHNVIVFGSINTDMSVSCTRMPQQGETVLGSTFVLTGGGKGANQAVTSARLGAKTYMVGKVGSDRLGSIRIAGLEEYGVRTSRIRTSSDVATGSALILRSKDDNRIVVDPGANICVTFDEVQDTLDTLAEPGDIFLTQFECLPEVIKASLAYARKKGLFTICNPSPALPIDDDMYKTIDLLCLNESECATLSGIQPNNEEDRLSALNFFAQKGVKQTILTLGAQGAVAKTADEVVTRPAFEVNCIDTTAAGDAFLGAVAACLSYDNSFDTTMEIAMATSALCVTKLGAQDAMPTFDEVQSFLASHK